MKRTHVDRRRLLRDLASLAALTAAAPLKAMAACSVIPSETNGPYPSDGTNGPNVLTQSGIVRSDIRASFGSAGTTSATGTLLTVTLQLVNTNANCAPLAGYAVYIWHCDAQGRYSMYSSGVTTQNYLRGVQVTDAEGKVTFTTVFPGCYSGRWPHIHFEVYENANRAIAGGNSVKVSQLALPEDVSRQVYAQASLYPSSTSNLNQLTLRTDNVFSDDGAALQLAAVTGNVSGGYAATLTAGIAGAAASGPDIDQAGLTGVWYEPASNGQGLAFEVMADQRGTGTAFIQGGWFTYDVAPTGGVEKQRWYSIGGEATTGSSAANLTIFQNTGGNFNAPPVTAAQAIGTAVMTFSSCTSGMFNYQLNDGRSGSIPLTRITQNATCSVNGNRPTNADFAHSGVFYDPATSGQGFVVEINPVSSAVFFCWYTFAATGQSLGAAGQRWFTGQSLYSVGSRSMTVGLYESTGGIFDMDTPATQATLFVGTATLSYSGCNNASVTYNFTGGSNAGKAGTIALTRIGNQPAGCPA